MTLIIRIRLDDPGYDWAEEDAQRAIRVQEAAEAAALDAAVEKVGWSGSVSSYYSHPDG